MAENFDVVGFELSAEEMSRIAGLDTGASAFSDHRDPGMTVLLGGHRFS